MKENWVYRRGDLYLANLGVPVGSKQGGSLEYMAAIFHKLANSDEDAMQLALEFYGPMYL